MKILGIESSCDESAIALLEIKNQKVKIIKNIISSQIDIHKKYGGIIPEIAARAHCENFPPILKNAKINFQEIDYIAATYGPGLITSLMTGFELGKTLSYIYKKPLIPINHIEAHIYSNWLSYPELFSKKTFPALAVVISGGHTQLFLMKDFGKYKLIGSTVDDAVGEAYDKVAKILNLDYPGGPIISKRASKFKAKGLDRNGENKSKIKFPRPMMHSKDFNLSFSGLKTAVLYQTKNEARKFNKEIINEYCFEFQEAVVEVLTSKIIKAAEKYQIKNIILGGGVSANQRIRENLTKEAQKLKIKTYFPELKHTGDNAAMIAMAGYFNRNKAKKDYFKLSANPNLSL